MLNFLSQETFWLTVTNIVLGSTTLVFLVAAVGATIYGLMARTHKGTHAHEGLGDHELVLSDFGITVAGRGKRLDEQKLLNSRGNSAGNRRRSTGSGLQN